MHGNRVEQWLPKTYRVGWGPGKQGGRRKGEIVIKGYKLSHKINSGHVIHGKYAN